MRGLSPPKSAARLERVFAAIDEANSGDPNQFGDRPLAQAEGQIASAWIDRLAPGATDVVRIAARAHHLRRWETPRSGYPEGRAGYLRWRRDQKRRHAAELAGLMADAGYDRVFCERAGDIVLKRRLGSDPEVQLYEDALALTFLETQFDATAERLGDDRMVDVLARTLAKMTGLGRAAAAEVALSPRLADLLERAQSAAAQV